MIIIYILIVCIVPLTDLAEEMTTDTDLIERREPRILQQPTSSELDPNEWVLQRKLMQMRCAIAAICRTQKMSSS